MKTVGIPLILTFRLDPLSQERLDHWREIYFPKERNFLKAHLTIYHQLPGQNLRLIKEQLATLAKDRRRLSIRFDRLMTRQGFVGIAVESELMQAFRGELNEVFQTLLRAQDRQPYRPHVTVTNLGSPKDAARTLAALEREFNAWDGEITGLELFHYRGGPWELAAIFPFDSSSR